MRSSIAFLRIVLGDGFASRIEAGLFPHLAKQLGPRILGPTPPVTPQDIPREQPELGRFESV
jgi:hypothetical protein